jgi:hypothetical protein
MFYFPCTPEHKIVLLFTGQNNEDKNIFWDGEQIIYFHVNRYIIWICQRFVKQYKKKSPQAHIKVSYVNYDIWI